jgi:hypothetical protein
MVVQYVVPSNDLHKYSIDTGGNGYIPLSTQRPPWRLLKHRGIRHTMFA